MRSQILLRWWSACEMRWDNSSSWYIAVTLRFDGSDMGCSSIGRGPVEESGRIVAGPGTDTWGVSRPAGNGSLTISSQMWIMSLSRLDGVAKSSTDESCCAYLSSTSRAVNPSCSVSITCRSILAGFCWRWWTFACISSLQWCQNPLNEPKLDATHCFSSTARDSSIHEARSELPVPDAGYRDADCLSSNLAAYISIVVMSYLYIASTTRYPGPILPLPWVLPDPWDSDNKFGHDPAYQLRSDGIYIGC